MKELCSLERIKMPKSELITTIWFDEFSALAVSLCGDEVEIVFRGEPSQEIKLNKQEAHNLFNSLSKVLE